MSAAGIVGWLTPEEYRLLVSPAVRAAAEAAARRGDPDLYHDMACMLALLATVSALVQAYEVCREQFPAASSPATLEQVPIAVCALVLSRSGLEPLQVAECLQALSTAHRTLLRAGILGPQDAYVEKAFMTLRQPGANRAHRRLLQAVYAMAKAVDEWERRRDAGLPHVGHRHPHDEP